MSPREAQSVLDNLEPDVPFFLRTDWIRALAALTSVYRTEVDRVAPGPNRKVFQLLHSAAAAGRSEWYFNNLRMRHLLEPSRLSLLPIGTTSNEALHHEINNWFRETQKNSQSYTVFEVIYYASGKALVTQHGFISSSHTANVGVRDSF